MTSKNDEVSLDELLTNDGSSPSTEDVSLDELLLHPAQESFESIQKTAPVSSRLAELSQLLLPTDKTKTASSIKNILSGLEQASAQSVPQGDILKAQDEGMSRVARWQTGGWSDKAGALKDMLLGGGLGQEYDAQRQKLAQSPAMSYSESMTRSITDPITAAMSAPGAVYDKNLNERMDKYESWKSEHPSSAKFGEISGLITSPFNKFTKPGTVMGGAATGVAMAEGQSRPNEEVDLVGPAVLGGGLSMAAKVAPLATTGLVASAALGDNNLDSADAILPAIGAGLDVLTKKPKQSLIASGSALQLPGQVVDRIAGIIGKGINWAIDLPSAQKNIVRTKYTQQLSDIVGSGMESGTRGYVAAKQALGDLQFRDIKDIVKNPADKQQLFQALHDSYRYRGRDPYSPEVGRLLQSYEDALTKDGSIQNMTGSDFIKSVISDDVQSSLRELQNKFQDTNRFPKETMTEVAQLVKDTTNKALSSIDEGIVSHDLQMPGEGVFSTFAKGRVPFRLQGSERAEIAQKVPGFEGKSPSDVSAAQQALNNIGSGKWAMRTLGGIGGFAAGGIPGVLSPLAVEGMGIAGRALEETGRKMAPQTASKIAKSFISNPDMLNKLSQMNNSLGSTAKSVLDDLHQGNGVAAQSKAFLFATNPEFRKLFLGDQTEQPQP